VSTITWHETVQPHLAHGRRHGDLPADHRRRHRRCRAPHHRPRNRPLQGPRHPPSEGPV